MEIKKVVIENFLSYKKAELDFNYDGPVLVEGRTTNTFSDSNGAGKSSLFESILYGLFGVTSKGIKNDNLVNTFVKENCRVKIIGTHLGKSFKISRYRSHTTYKNQLFFYIENKDLRGSTNSDTQEKIQKFLNIDIDTILHTSFFSPSNTQAFCGLTDANQKNIFQSILGLSEWEDYYNKLNIEITQLESAIQTLKTKITITENQIQNTTENVLNLLDFRKDFYSTDVTSQIKELEIEKRCQLSFIETYKDRKANIELENRVEKILNQLEYQHEECRAKLELLGSLDASCPVCQQQVNRVSIEKLAIPINFKIEKCLEKIQELEDSLIKIRQTNRENDSLQQEVAKSKTNIKVIDEKLKNLYAAKEDYLNKQKNINLKIKQVKNKIKGLKHELGTITKECNEKTKEVTIAYSAKIACSNRGIKTYVIKNIIPDINTSLAEYSRLLMNNEIVISIDFDKEKNKLITNISKKGGIGYESCSTGEAKRVDICALLALLKTSQKLNKQVNFLVLDEIFDGLDSTGIKNVVEILNSLDYPNIFIITHNDKLKQYFENTITVENIDGISNILT